MDLRRDALAAAAELVLAVETHAKNTLGLRATVGAISASPGATNVVPGGARLSLDVRHANDAARQTAIAELLVQADRACAKRCVALHVERTEDHKAVPADSRLTGTLFEIAESLGHCPVRMVSGAGHDAAVMARIAPMAMLFVRSPGGISHHPDESVSRGDVQAALDVMVAFIDRLAGDAI
jgi:allantoate deiminase